MISSLGALIAVALVTAPAPEGRERAAPVEVALGVVPPGDIEATVVMALAAPPTIVVRDTHYYGKVTIDHARHLARRASCKTCHGPGPVSKIAFTPKLAHGRCVGCHQEQAKGPTRCQDCHVREEPPPAMVAAAASAEHAKTPKPPGPDPANVAAALAAFEARKGDAGGGAFGTEPFHRTLELGLAAGPGAGVSARVASYQDRVALTVSVERMSSDSQARTLGLVGAGLTRPVAARVSLEALAVAGFDALDRPTVSMLPAIGARAGLEWRVGLGYLTQLTGSVTGVVDVGSRRSSSADAGGATVYVTLATGFSLTRR